MVTSKAALGEAGEEASPGNIILTIKKDVASGIRWSGIMNILEFKALTTGTTIVTVTK